MAAYAYTPKPFDPRYAIELNCFNMNVAVIVHNILVHVHP